MFSFHKPKIYRSNLGCCICKAKSSSSRFTDSKKYENEFEHCFRIEEPRSGEICNACVLLVKRWKKLSPENRLTKHWHHVVDARAGPGTKLTSGRRFTGSQQNHHDSSGGSSSSSSASSSLSHQAGKQQSSASGSRLTDASGGPLPLSSSQSANQSNYGSRRTSSFVGKARAIDTNVTTFTFGEPLRRSYMATAESSSYSVASSSSSALHKPQSALNSSAFESVIKRFRQRQQQQQLEAERRQLSKQQRLNRQQQNQQVERKLPLECSEAVKQISTEETNISSSSSSQEDSNGSSASVSKLAPPPNKRVKRSSESIGSICVDGLRVSSLLDSSIWRKEKICCGIIFRGLHNEVVVFPKLLKPCQCRLAPASGNEDQQHVGSSDRQADSSSPPPRATKSGSISSCDSNTSGTGSMEPAAEELAAKQLEAARYLPRRKQAPKTQLADSCRLPTVEQQLHEAPKRPRSTRASRRNQQLESTGSVGRKSDSDSIISTSSSSVLSALAEPSLASKDNTNQQEVHSPGSSSTSGNSSSRRLLLMANELEDEDEDEDDDEDDEEDVEEVEDDEDEHEELTLDEEEEDADSNTDASSSVDSLTEVERKKSTGANPVGAMG